MRFLLFIITTVCIQMQYLILVYLNFRFTQMNDVYCVNIQCIHMNLRRMTLHVMNNRLNTSSCVFLFVSLFFIFLPFVFVFFVCLFFGGFFQQSIFHLWPNLDTPPFPLKIIESKQALALKVELSLHCQVVQLMTARDR